MARFRSEVKPLAIPGNNGLKSYCWTLGDRKNPALLLLAGYTATHEDVWEVAELLKEKYFVIAPDLPGWGKSPRFSEKLTIHNYALYLKSLLDYLNISKVTLCGHCMGAIVAIEFAYLYPEATEKLILVSTPYLVGTLGQDLLIHLTDLSQRSPKRFRKLFFLWRSRLFATPFGFYYVRTRNFRKKMQLIYYTYKFQPLQSEDSVEENFLSIIHYDYSKIQKIKAPIHLIQGDEDIIIGKRQFMKLCGLVPSASVDFLAHTGHLPPAEDPQALVRAIFKY
jgi:pimeloyl-ACP methyl ester carboxylesterase